MRIEVHSEQAEVQIRAPPLSGVRDLYQPVIAVSELGECQEVVPSILKERHATHVQEVRVEDLQVVVTGQERKKVRIRVVQPVP